MVTHSLSEVPHVGSELFREFVFPVELPAVHRAGPASYSLGKTIEEAHSSWFVRDDDFAIRPKHSQTLVGDRIQIWEVVKN